MSFSWNLKTFTEYQYDDDKEISEVKWSEVILTSVTSNDGGFDGSYVHLEPDLVYRGVDDI